MDESGLPGSTQSPPSYLRPANLPQESFLWNSHLLLVVGLAAISLILWGASIFGGASTRDTLLFYGLSPTNVYQHSLATGEVKPLFDPSIATAPITPQKGLLVGVVLSPRQDLFVAAFQKTRTIELSAFTFTGKPLGTIAEGIEGQISMAISPDSKRLAYLTRSHLPHENASQMSVPIFNRNGPESTQIASTTEWLYLTIAPLDTTSGKPQVYPFAAIPVGFSQEGETLLLRHIGWAEGKSLSLFTFGAKKAFKYIGGTPNEQISSAALSLNGKYLALALPHEVQIGTVDWERAVFTRIAAVPSSAQTLMFSEGDVLSVYTPGKIMFYTVTDSGVNRQSSFSAELEGLHSMLGVVTP